MKIKAKLMNGRRVALQHTDFNPFGQIILSKLVTRGLASDEYTMAELLGASPCEIRYGMVHPHVAVTVTD